MDRYSVSEGLHRPQSRAPSLCMFFVIADCGPKFEFESGAAYHIHALPMYTSGTVHTTVRNLYMQASQ